ncbi:MAG: type II secretion system F family protein [Gemmatimonadota bacterium]
MTRYRYRAATAAGRVLEGEVDAESRARAIAELHRQRLFPVTLERAVVDGPGRLRFRSRRAALGTWTREMAALLSGGVPLDRALSITGDHVGHDGLASAIAEVRREVQQGRGLAAAMERHPGVFPVMAVAMVAAGEESGQVETIFEQLADHLEEAGELVSQVRSALVYPALMAVVATAGVTILLLFVVPRFSAMLKDVGGTLPVSTRLLMSAGDFVAGWWWLLLLVVIGLTLGVRSRLRQPEGRLAWHEFRLRLPWIGELESQFATARFARTFAVLLRSGLAVVPSLQIARSVVGNDAIGARLDHSIASISEGATVSKGLSGALSPVAVHMIATGEESGRLDDMCEHVASAYDADVRRTVRTLVSLLEPAMILVFGAIVGLVALAMLQAIYSINTTSF